VRDFVYFAGVFGLSAVLVLLHVGEVYRWSGRALDRLLFKNRWSDEIPERERGGPLSKLVACMACTSFWVSIGMSRVWYCPLAGGWPDRVVVGLASVGIVFAAYVVLVKLGLYEI
jgi:hypothetical protein